MRFFRKPPPIVTPPEVKKAQRKTHNASKEATQKVAQLNELFSNGITVRILRATGGTHGH